MSIALGLGLGAITLVACGSDDNTSTSTSSSAAGNDSVPGADSTASAAFFNDADVAFAQGMIPHHEQAVEMADMALDPAMGASEQVRDLATRIEAAQGPEIDMMGGWMTAWGQSMPMDMGDGGMSSSNGMMSADEMASLGVMTGAEFDSMWVELMIRHHEGAIAMAETAKSNGSNPEALALADQIITVQQAEIAEMTALLPG